MMSKKVSATDPPVAFANWNNQDLRHFIELIPGAAYIRAAAARVILFVNSRAAAALGYAPGEIANMGDDLINAMIHPDDAAQIDEHENKLRNLSFGETQEIQYRLRVKSGEWRWFSSREAVFRRDAEGRVTHVIGTANDITARKRTEQALIEAARQQQALYQLADRLHHSRSLTDVFDAALDAILRSLGCGRASVLLFDDTGVMRFVAWRGLSDAYRRAVEGHSPWTADTESPLPACIADGDASEIDESLRHALKREGIGALAFIPLVSDGSLIGKFMIYFDAPHVFSRGELELAQAIARQLSFGIERRRAEEALRYQFDLTQTIAENTRSCLMMLDSGGRITYLNRAAERVTGFKPDELIGEILHDKIHHMHTDGTLFQKDQCPLNRALPLGESVNGYEDAFVHKNGHFYPVRCNAQPIFRDGKPVGTVIEVQDISEEKRVAAEREAMLEREQILREQAEEANRLKDEFLATVSHELRTPLTSILGWTKMIRQSGYNKETTIRAVEVIERNSQNQNKIISDILDVSRIIRGKLTLNMQPLELAQVVRAAIDTVRPAIEAKGIRLTADLEADVQRISGDSDRLQQVFWNLLSNAAKFTPNDGSIRVALRKEQDCAEIRVTDDGQGIEADFLPFVFERFRQGQNQMNRQHGGLGLGLSIVRNLVELHGGSVAVESAGRGEGSTFIVRLPLKADLGRPADGQKVAAAEAANCQTEQTESASR